MTPQTKIPKLSISPLLAVFLVLQLLILIFLSSSIIRANTPADPETEEQKNTISISNIDQIFPKVGADEKESIEGMLHNAIKYNTTSFTRDVEVAIRKEGIIKKNYPAEEVRYYNFIAEVPELKQEYQVAVDVSYGEMMFPDDAVVISCVEKDKKYQDFACHLPNGAATKFDVIFRHLEYEDFDDLIVSPPRDDSNDIIIDMTNSTATPDAATDRVKKYIESMGYAVDGFTFNAYSGESWTDQ